MQRQQSQMLNEHNLMATVGVAGRARIVSGSPGGDQRRWVGGLVAASAVSCVLIFVAIALDGDSASTATIYQPRVSEETNKPDVGKKAQLIAALRSVNDTDNREGVRNALRFVEACDDLTSTKPINHAQH